MKENYLDYAYKGYSQNGEQGVLERIFQNLNIDKGWFVDVGAWDGKYLSNTYRFVELGWDGVEIERDSERVRKMIEILPERIIKMRSCVKPDPGDLDLLLQLAGAPYDIDLLSIDIDSYDYWVWKHMKTYSSKIVVIEYNGDKDSDNIYPPKYSGSRVPGTSMKSMVGLGREKGYKLICELGNLIFGRDDIYEDL